MPGGQSRHAVLAAATPAQRAPVNGQHTFVFAQGARVPKAPESVHVQGVALCVPLPGSWFL